MSDKNDTPVPSEFLIVKYGSTESSRLYNYNSLQSYLNTIANNSLANEVLVMRYVKTKNKCYKLSGLNSYKLSCYKKGWVLNS